MKLFINRAFIVLFVSIQLIFCISFVLRVDINGVNNSGEDIIFTNETVKEVMNGKLGYQYNEWFSNSFPYRKFVIKTYNQWKYNVFNEISNGWILGKDGWMYSEGDSQKLVMMKSNSSDEQMELYAKK